MRLGSRVTLSIALLSVVATASVRWLGAAEWLVADAPAIARFEVWRLLTGPLVHATAGHLVRDLALLFFVGIAFERELGRSYLPLCALGLIVPTIVALSDPTIGAYYGTSGLTHALLAVAIGHTLFARDPRYQTPTWMRGLAAAGAGALFGKVVWELSVRAPLFEMALGPGIRQLPSAHAAGALLGAVFVTIRLVLAPLGYGAKRPATGGLSPGPAAD